MMSCRQFQERLSVQKDILRRKTSTKQRQDNLFCSSYGPGAQEFGTEACFEHILVPQETRFPGRCCFSWTRILAFNASVPKNMKNVFVRTRISRSKLLCRDEKIRKKGFCAESWQPWGEGQIPISRVWPLTFTATSHLRIVAFSTDPDRSPVCILCAMNKLRGVSYLFNSSSRDSISLQLSGRAKPRGGDCQLWI